MEIIKNIEKLNIENASVAIGKFNGIHLGHMRLIKNIVNSQVPVIFTFQKMPLSVLKKIPDAERILDNEEEMKIFEKAGIKYVIQCPGNKEILSLNPEEFVKGILVDKLHIQKLVCGKDFRFAKDREGDINVLEKLSLKYGFTLEIIDDYEIRGVKVSSSTIKEYIKNGNMEKVTEFLGKPYSITGIIREGRKIGRTLDFPTINIVPPQEKILPPFGVYYTKVYIDGKEYKGVTNIGKNPTVTDNGGISVETNLIETNEQLYGKHAVIDFYHFVRKERKFETFEALKKQISHDVDGFNLK